MKKRFLAALTLATFLPALLLFSGCDRHDHDDHHVMDRVIIETRGLTPQVVAEWERGTGWDVESLPTLAVGDANDNWGRASWTVRIFEGGQEVDLSPTGPGVCGEHAARYVVDDPGVIFWDETGTVVVGNAPREIFHCNHIHVYPRAEGTTELEIVLWHVDHADGRTDPIAISVTE